MKKKIIVSLFIVTTIVSFALGKSTNNPTNATEPTTETILISDCIPLEDIAGYYIDNDGFTHFELKDIGNQLDNPSNKSYTEILSETSELEEN